MIQMEYTCGCALGTTCPNDMLRCPEHEHGKPVNQAAAHQPMPVPNNRTPIQDLVIADIEARKQVGLQRYGTLLQAFNGRDALMDAYQEVLDLAVYFRQMIEERDAPVLVDVTDHTAV